MSKARLRRRAAQAVTLALLIAVWLPAAALAGSGPAGGVHIDPGSPAAKEYSIPLGSARGNGTSGTSNLFGSGITHKGSGGGGTPTASSASPGGSSSPGGASSPAGASAPSPTPPTTATVHPTAAAPSHPVVHHQRRHRAGAHRRVAAHLTTSTTAVPVRAPSPQSVIGTNSDSGAGITWMLGAAVIVLVLGALGAVVVARRSRGTSPTPS